MHINHMLFSGIAESIMLHSLSNAEQILETNLKGTRRSPPKILVINSNYLKCRHPFMKSIPLVPESTFGVAGEDQMGSYDCSADS